MFVCIISVALFAVSFGLVPVNVFYFLRRAFDISEVFYLYENPHGYLILMKQAFVYFDLPAQNAFFVLVVLDKLTHSLRLPW